MGETKLKVATMTLPVGAKEAWTGLMRGSASVAGSIEQNTPIVQAHAVFSDGTQVIGGVLKSDTPAEYNIKFMWVFNAKGERHPGWPIDVGDHEDFKHAGYVFSLTEGVDEEYSLDVVEASEVKAAPKPKAKAKTAPKAKAKAKTAPKAATKVKAKTAPKAKARAKKA